MAIHHFDLFNSPNIGVYARTIDKLTIIPAKISSRKIKHIQKSLKGEVVITTIGESRLVGVLTAANSNGIILPHYTSKSEVEAVKQVWKGNIARINSKRTALGNLILANDRGAVASENLMKEQSALRKIHDILDVEIVPGEIARLPYIGSLAIATNKGVLAHPMIEETERQTIEDVLHVPVDVGTINGGIPFVSSGLLANDSGVLIGTHTTGPEIMIITNVFDR